MKIIEDNIEFIYYKHKDSGVLYRSWLHLNRDEIVVQFLWDENNVWYVDTRHKIGKFNRTDIAEISEEEYIFMML